MDTGIVIKADPIPTIPATVVGKKYQIRPPKWGLSLKIAVAGKQAGDDPSKMVDAVDEWVGAAFGTKAEEIRKRLNDPDDALDFEHIMDLMGQVMEKSSEDEGNPTS